MKAIVALRTHIWNDDIEYISRRLRGAFNNCEFVIIADESKETLQINSFPKISHKDNFSEFDLPQIPEKNFLWFNGDYPLYKLRKEFPQYEYIIMVENDVLVNFDLDRLVSFSEENKIDLIVHNMSNADDNWYHYDTVSPYFNEAKKCLFPFILISAQAIDYLLALRVKIFNDYYKKVGKWPYCEGFIASALYQEKSFNIVDIDKFCSTENYDFYGCRHYLDPEVNKKNSISHPVRGKEFVKRRIHEDGIESFFDKSSVLRKSTKFVPVNDFFDVVFAEIKKLKNIDRMNNFNDIALEEGWITKPYPINLALGGKASQSSISPFSLGQSLYDDAQRAIDGNLDKDYGFHTSLENNPWWLLELPDAVNIRHIIIYNRKKHKERARKLYVSLSIDGAEWKEVAAYPDGIWFGGDDGYPLVIKVNSVYSKFVKIGLLSHGILHLNQVEIYST
ncbi:discoidin domain-containing protein [Acetobacter senegalensis]|uniref:discoidin domain-containing protein n=2 Tax=Acetobacter senegalensis TaxID=446692 RepID=UPI001EDC12E6|nr:discoidin domain-containing protein [Acetobacter senegalensis]MCG4262555.1 discoidin domain-containing protein [Acetobacter senegalensis]